MKIEQDSAPVPLDACFSLFTRQEQLDADDQVYAAPLHWSVCLSR